jgi:hypothetical protein
MAIWDLNQPEWSNIREHHQHGVRGEAALDIYVITLSATLTQLTAAIKSRARRIITAEVRRPE